MKVAFFLASRTSFTFLEATGTCSSKNLKKLPFLLFKRRVRFSSYFWSFFLCLALSLIVGPVTKNGPVSYVWPCFLFCGPGPKTHQNCTPARPSRAPSALVHVQRPGTHELILQYRDRRRWRDGAAHSSSTKRRSPSLGRWRSREQRSRAESISSMVHLPARTSGTR